MAEPSRDPPFALSADFMNFSPRDTASRWLASPDLQREVYRHLAVYVPRILCQGGGGREEQREELACQLLLLAPLEWLLLGGEPASGLALLQQSNRSSPLCGHVFKVGEPTYSCRECAADPTCVLCMPCFLASVHRHHRYRMTTSGGGGFCDCGDAEAWKTGPYCQNHTPADQNREAEEDPVSLLPPAVVARSYSIFSIILKYAVDLLTWEQEDQLPAGLEPPERGDNYYCMLFNDEVHTYEQVIYTLQKAVNCSQKEAVSFATTVDRDGRKSVRFGDHQFCEQAKSIIVRNTSRQSKPLRVQVMHSSVVAHQCFALKALSWLGQIIQYSDGLKRILCQVGLQKGLEGENSSLVDRLMLNDSKMWKGARNIYHQLLMNSLLMDLKFKKIFAIQFAKNYRRLQTDFMEDDHERVVSVTSLSVQLFTVPSVVSTGLLLLRPHTPLSLCVSLSPTPTQNYERLQSDYIRDDHDREFSITDLSVQMFTVPSLARMLMVEENLMMTIIRTFVDHLRHRDPQGRFQFDRYTAQQAFKFGRVQSLIGDLKYVLISPPPEWSDQLRTKFLDGFEAFLDLLRCMQGMDPVVRQVGQHIEMEPEWEAAFTLQMKLTHIISMIQEWCSTDERVLIEAYKKCLSALSQCHGSLTDGEQPISLSLAGHSVDTIRYQVSQEKVSIHLPVCRLLAGLHVLLSRTEVASRFPEQLPLGELSPHLLIELPLRCLVLCAQVHAGMWRRNGFSLINQIYYYHNVKCRVEMFDKDVVMLQVGASMMDPNHFLMIVLSRFELFHIFSCVDIRKRYREANKDLAQQNTLIEEMLHLIIMVVGERYVPGVGQVEPLDEVRREILHQLSIRPMAHSELVKALPENGNKETGLERVIDSVASFKKPGVTGRGLYELRPEWSKHFNLYFHHYSRADQSKAEEAQRKLRRQNGEDTALPPPLPPPLCPLFGSLVNLLQCDVLLAVEGAVLQWAVEPSGGGWTESMLQRVLHLVGMALLEEQQQLESSSADEDVSFRYSSKITRPGEAPSTSGSILALLESLQNAPHLEVHKDMITWILKMVGNIKTIQERTSSSSSINVGQGRGPEETVRDKDKAERKRKAEMARLRREKIMAQMSEMQKHFINENKELFQQSMEELEASSSATEHSPPSSESTCASQICVGPRRMGGAERRQLVTCILCQEEQEVRGHGRAMVLAAFIQRSTVLSKNRSRSVPDPERHDPLFMHPDLSVGIHTASCGHIMHATCWQRYFEAVQQKEQRRQQRLRGHTSYDVENGEFLCPLCECLSNTVIPLLPHTCSPDRSVEHPCLETWLKRTSQQIAVLNSTHRKQSHGAAQQVEPAVPEGFRVNFVPQNPFSSSIGEMMNTFSMSAYKVGLKVNPNEQDPRVPVLSWSTCAYTMQSIERLLMDEKKPLLGSLPCRQDDCLSSLTRFSSACWTAAPLRTVHSHFIRLLTVLLPDSQLEDAPCILNVDMFHLLVYSVLSYSSLHSLDQSERSSVDSAHLHLLHLVTVAHLVQILVTCSTEELSMDQDGEESEEEQLTCQLYSRLREHLGSVLPEVSSGWQLWRCVKAGVLPFLRTSALFFHYLNSSAPPADLLGTGPGQWEALCSYLSLPSNLLLLYQNHRTLLEPLIHRWCSHPGVGQVLQGGGVLLRFPRESNRLINLPEDYSILINQASSFTCPRSGGDKSRAPTLCLVCGCMLCSQSYCCQTEVDGEDVGACTAHTFTCGAGIGLFLRVRESQVLFVAGKTKGCFYPPPYLDDYGETDPGLKRGNPLHLCSERYKKIERLWRQHGIAEVIGHAQEANQTLVAIDWQHL
ncbi:LOW QUALITY PROTEIN: E3 ubiquitin-protein ligase UBR2 [Anableps anableps]